MKTVLVAAALFIGAAAVSAQAQTTNSTQNSSQTRTGAGVDLQTTSGTGSISTTDSRATRAYPVNGNTDKAKTGSTNRRRSSAPSTEQTGAGMELESTSGTGSISTTDSRATRAYPVDATTKSTSTQSTSKKSTTKSKKSGN